MESIRTDLAIEAHEICSKDKAEETKGVSVRTETDSGVTVTEINITSAAASRELGKPKGCYITLEAPDIIFNTEVYERACEKLSGYIRELSGDLNGKTVLVVGLGNKEITPDALGPTVVSKLMVTKHVKKALEKQLSERLGTVCAIAPGVLGTTGIETAEIVKGVAERLKPSLIIAVDALASRSLGRISTTIQLSDTGISPGSGVENKRDSLTEENMGVKVLAIGVPTVVDAATVAADCIAISNGENNRDIIRRALCENIGNLMVTPKDIDRVIEKASRTVANGINLALHKDLSFEDIESFVG